MILNMEMPGKAKRGRPERFMDLVKEDMFRVGVTKEATRDSVRWMQLL